MSSNVKNYTEQGGARTVIGGELVFEDGARVSGLPSDSSAAPVSPDVAYYVLDLEGIDLSTVLQEPLEITGLFPPETFEAASGGYKPVLFRNAVFYSERFSVLSVTGSEGNYITGVGVIPSSNEAKLQTLVTVMIYRDEDRVMLRANENRRLGVFLDDNF